MADPYLDVRHPKLENSMKVKFISLNILHGGELFDEMLAFLKKEDADILALQEVYDGKGTKLEKRFRSFDVLTEELSFSSQAFSPAFLHKTKEVKVAQGNAVFSKFPIVSSDTLFYDVPFGTWDWKQDEKGNFERIQRNLQHAEVEIEGKVLNVFNTQGIWGFDGEDNERRLGMSETILKELEGKSTIILSGDFNVKPHTKTIKHIENKLNNVFKGELKTTFNMKRKENPGYASAVVDMVFVSDDIKVLEHTCPAVDISDHLPLVCVFEV